MAEFTGERVIPGQVDPDLFNEHFARYAFASRFAPRRRVLDIGCGSGYGSAELARTALAVTGLDVSGEAIAFARAAWPNVEFLEGSALHIPLSDGGFDLIVAFEVIEHLDEWPLLLQEARRLLAPGGQFILSTPNKSYYAETRKQTGPNPFHVHEFEFGEFSEALGAVFPHVSFFLQNHVAGIAFEPLSKANAADVRIEAETHDPSTSHFYIAVCALDQPVAAPAFVYLPSAANILRERERHIEQLDGWLNQARSEHQKLVTLFREQTAELEQRNEWARQLDAELDTAREHIDRLEKLSQSFADQLEAKVAELGGAVEALHATEAELTARTNWALQLESENTALKATVDNASQSRWIRLGRTLGVGPVLLEP